VALRVLGPAAKGAIPDLAQVINDPKSAFSARSAIFALVGLGDQAVPVLLAGLTNQISRHRLVFVELMGTNALPAVPSLIKLLADPDPGIRNAATNALLKIDPQSLEKPGGQ
jgi:HEAT repeat protein